MPGDAGIKGQILEREATASLLEDLLAIPSPSHMEGEAASYLLDWLGAHGFQAYLDGVGNVVGERGEGPREVLLLGHIDTFPGELPVYCEDGWLYGRGSVDAKGPLCALASSAAAVDLTAGWRVKVVAAVEEEVPGSRGAHYLASLEGRPDYCVIGEPSGWDRIALGYKGILLAKARLRLPYAHSAGQGKLPAETAVEWWNRVASYCEGVNNGRDREFHRLTPHLRSIASSDDGVFGIVELEADFRLPPDIASRALEPVIIDLLASVATEGTYELEVIGREEAFLSEKNTPLVRVFLAAIREQEGKPRFVIKTGTTDMNVVGPVWRCPIVAYGPGDSSLDHTPEERIHLEEYWRSIAILTTMLRMLIV